MTIPRRASRGSALVELLAAIPIIALLAAVSIKLLLSASRLAQHTDATLSSSHELRHASSILAAELRPLDARDLVAWSDSTIEFEAIVASGIVCNGRSARNRIDLLPDNASDPAATHSNLAIQAGDRAVAILSNARSRTLNAAPVRTASVTIRSVLRTRSCVGAPLVDSAPAPTAPTISLQLADTLPDFLQSGGAIRIIRRVRYSIYQSGTSWFLGRRERTNSIWDVVQPVAGPLLSPRARGLTVDVRDAHNARLRSADSSATMVRLEMRSLVDALPGATALSGSRIDSVAVVIALRAAPR